VLAEIAPLSQQKLCTSARIFDAFHAIARPAVSEKRLSQLSNGHVRYELKTPYCDGTTHVIFEPMDFIARLVALVPKP
jgi:hypothetical protein